jgi:hypothetical protein
MSGLPIDASWNSLLLLWINGANSGWVAPTTACLKDYKSVMFAHAGLTTGTLEA